MLGHFTDLRRYSLLRLRAHFAHKALMKDLDLEGWQKIVEKTHHLEPIPQLRGLNGITGALKYLDFHRFMRMNIERYLRLNIPNEKCKIADLGCGAGYFLFFCSLKGHEAIGLDRPSSPDFDPQGPEVFDLMTQFFRLHKIAHTIEAKKSLPNELQGLDLITAFNTWFDGSYIAGEKRTYRPWSTDEWIFFLSDCLSRLRPNGRIYLEVNEKWEFQTEYYFPYDLHQKILTLPVTIKKMEKGTLDLIKQGPYQ